LTASLCNFEANSSRSSLNHSITQAELVNGHETASKSPDLELQCIGTWISASCSQAQSIATNSNGSANRAAIETSSSLNVSDAEYSLKRWLKQTDQDPFLAMATDDGCGRAVKQIATQM
jgi:hypothetical protein